MQASDRSASNLLQGMDIPFQSLSPTDIHMWYKILPSSKSFRFKSTPLLQVLCSHYLNIKPHLLSIFRTQNGKPFVPDHSIEFNLSHTSQLVIIVFSLSSVGVDLECRNRRMRHASIAKRFFHPNEYNDYVHSESPQETFLEIWTRKESWIKAQGSTISRDLDCDLSSQSFSQIPDYFFHTFNTHQNHICTICTPIKQATIVDYSEIPDSLFNIGMNR